MKCAKLRLQERIPPTKTEKATKCENPRRFCQKRLVNPEHEEDPRWIDIFKRFHCDEENDLNVSGTAAANPRPEDIFLTVQTLKFQGATEERKRSRTSFKYKNPTNNIKHRMFIKQVVTEPELNDEEKSSELTCYFFDDYIKYLYHTDKSRPASGMSSIFLQGLSTKMDNTAEALTGVDKKMKKPESKLKQIIKKSNKTETIRNESENDTENTKIVYKNTGKRKSLTISRTQSPETVQVIRVDVVCNYTSNISPALSDYVEEKKENPPTEPQNNTKENTTYKNNFTSKYQLTNTIKTLDEHLSGGAKVTLLCKTFRLSDRGKEVVNKKPDQVLSNSTQSRSKKAKK